MKFDITNAYNMDSLKTEMEETFSIINQHFNNSAEQSIKTFKQKTPEEQLLFWEKEINNDKNDFKEFVENLLENSMNFRNKGYLGHQVATPLPLTTLTSTLIGYMNNSTTVYELGMSGVAMEKIVIDKLVDFFGYQKDSFGFVTSGGSMGNLTALLTARDSIDIEPEEYHKLAIMVSEEAHYSVERSAQIMGIPADNIIKIPTKTNYKMNTDLLSTYYEKAKNDGKIVFCIIGSACTTSLGIYDDLIEISNFAHENDIWFHIDGAHGGAAIFSDKFSHFLDGTSSSDSIIVDFHKMMLTPSLSTAIIFNAPKSKKGKLSPNASYLWDDQNGIEWYNSARHTIECTKPISIVHTYAIMKFYGTDIYKEHINRLYDLAKVFAKKIDNNKDMELAIQPESNIVCFRYISTKKNKDLLNKKILMELLKDGTFYIVSTSINGNNYLRISIMNDLTTENTLDDLLENVITIAHKFA